MAFDIREKNDKTEHVFIKGKFKYAPHVYNLNDFGKWVVCIYPDEESMKIVNKLKEEGIKNILKKDEDGYYISFSRLPSIKAKGKEVLMTAPEVIDKDGKPLVQPIGAGSDGWIKLEVYGGPLRIGGRYKAARLCSVRIDNLVPFEKKDFTQSEIEKLEGLAEQPKMLW